MVKRALGNIKDNELLFIRSGSMKSIFTQDVQNYKKLIGPYKRCDILNLLEKQTHWGCSWINKQLPTEKRKQYITPVCMSPHYYVEATWQSS